MKCPKCGKEIDHVKIYEEQRFYGALEGDEVVDYEFECVIDGFTGIECPECAEDISDYVRQLP